MIRTEAPCRRISSPRTRSTTRSPTATAETDTTTLSIVVFNPGAHYQGGENTTLDGGNGPDVLDGSAGLYVLLGGNGPDVLIGGAGDTLTGGNGPDTYLFRPDFGANLVTDLSLNNDRLQLIALLYFTSIADILGHTSDVAGEAVIDDGTATRSRWRA